MVLAARIERALRSNLELPGYKPGVLPLDDASKIWLPAQDSNLELPR